MSRIAVFIFLSLGMFSLPVSAADSETQKKAQDVFDSLYGAGVKRVRATKDTADDAALAAKILEAARTVEAQPEFLAILCTNACELAAARTDAGRNVLYNHPSLRPTEGRLDGILPGFSSAVGAGKHRPGPGRPFLRRSGLVFGWGHGRPPGARGAPSGGQPLTSFLAAAAILAASTRM